MAVWLLALPLASVWATSPKTGELPADVWTVKEDPDQGITDAVELSHVVRLFEDRIEHYRLVRIFSRRGQEAFGVLPLGDSVDQLEGRIVDASGKETVIDPVEDVAELLAYRYAGQEVKLSYLTPPGLTSDCVLEVSWHEKVEKGLPPGYFMRAYPVPGPFFVKEKRFEFNNLSMIRLSNFMFSDQIVDIVTRFFWSKIPPPARFNQSVKEGFTVLTYTDVPALQDHPFGSVRRDDMMALVQVFRTFPFEAKTIGGFWDSFGKTWVGVWYDFFQKKNTAYNRWIRDVQDRLPDHGPAGARIALAEYHRRMTRADLLSPEQLTKLSTRSVEPIEFNDDLVIRTFNRRYIFGENVGTFFYRYLADLGFKPLLVFGPPDAESHFDEREFNPFALDLQHPAFGIPDPDDAGRMLMLTPAEPTLPPGMIPSHWHGRKLLTIDSGNNWNHGFIGLDHRSWKSHQQLVRLTMVLREDGHVQFTLRRRQTGYFDAELHEHLLPLSEMARREIIADDFQARLANWRIDGAKVLHVGRTDEEIEVQLRAVSKLDVGNDWVAVLPFPGVTPLLEVPTSWPETRRQPVVLPFNRGQIAQSEIRLPAGWRLRGKPSWQRENAVGTVSFKAWQKDDRVLVERRVIVADCDLEATADADLRRFLTWMTMADQMTVAIDKGGQP